MKFLIVLILCLAPSQEEDLPARRDGRIVGGSLIPIADAPYQAAIMFESSTGSEFVCGGE